MFTAWKGFDASQLREGKKSSEQGVIPSNKPGNTGDRLCLTSHALQYLERRSFPEKMSWFSFFKIFFVTVLFLRCPQTRHCKSDFLLQPQGNGSASPPHLCHQSTGNVICKVETPSSRRKVKIPCLSTVEQPRVSGSAPRRESSGVQTAKVR